MPPIRSVLTCYLNDTLLVPRKGDTVIRVTE